MSYGLVQIPIMSALNRLVRQSGAYENAFLPCQTQKIAGFVWQGIFPKKQEAIVSKLGKLVKHSLFSIKMLEQKMTRAEHFEKLIRLIEKHIDVFLRLKLPREMPMIGMFIGDKTINELKMVFLAELKELFPVIMKNYMGRLQQEPEFEKLVIDKIAGLPSVKWLRRSAMGKN